MTFKHALVDNDASMNLRSYQTFKAIGILERWLVRQSLNVSGFDAVTLQTLGHVSIDLKVNKIRWPIIFHFIDALATYNVILGRSWIHDNKAIPLTLHQYLKARWRGQDIFVPAAS
ncbi:hypothetical protein CFOL_v3_05312 [Cephalotus follicularis]|uniref:Uncharacterized protein n=1 Tax=Cephalotus follicularis TaxID=3775 RepID=A0A1Q3B199_CEPFO|nr:hypothetical protein CFOL_v3_05312 [Cephalotus follicularis]